MLVRENFLLYDCSVGLERVGSRFRPRSRRASAAIGQCMTESRIDLVAGLRNPHLLKDADPSDLVISGRASSLVGDEFSGIAKVTIVLATDSATVTLSDARNDA
jgi:hypothetical protein